MKIRHAILLYSLMLGVFVSIIDLTVNSIPPLGGKFWDTLLIALNTRKIIEYTSMIFVFLLYGWIIDRFLKEQKRIKGELLHEREFLQILMENVPVSIYFKDLQSRFTRINRYQARVLGVKTPEEALGHTDLDFFPPEPAHEALQDEQNIMKTGQPLTEKMIHYQINDGSHHWFTDTKVPIQDRDGTITGIVGISRDITDLKNMMDRLQESEALFRAVFESSAMGIMLIDRQEYPFQINPAIQNILGYPLDELCHLTFEQVTHPDDIEKCKEMNAQLYAGQCDHYQLEKRYLRKNGEIVWVWLTTSLVRDGEGNILFRMAIVEDITERVKAKQALVEEQSLLRTLFDIIPDLIDVKDTKSRFLLFNQPLMNFFGVKTPEELKGKTDFDFYPADLAETFFSEEQRIMTTVQPMMNRETNLKDGRWLSGSNLPLRNGK
ncbi:MAG: PAS domain S-box protein, partial [Atribacterota bacterium]